MSLRVISLLCFALASASSASAQDETRSERIMYGFVPDAADLRMIPGEELAQKYAGRTIAGIYWANMHDDQRFVETLNADQSVAYRERKFAAAGRWFVRGDEMCYQYEDQPDREHCFYEFEYGSCIIAYSSSRAVVNGKPVRPDRWSSVNRMVDADFAWPDVPASEADEFSCTFSMV